MYKERFMVNSKILAGKENIEIGAADGSVVARGGNYIVNANVADIANYAREGDNLIVEFANGQNLVLRDFFLNGANNLVLTDGANMQLVDFSSALTSTGDGISEAALAYDALASSGANMTLLGLLGLAAAGAGVAAAASGSGGHDHNTAGGSASKEPSKVGDNPEQPGDKPEKPGDKPEQPGDGTGNQPGTDSFDMDEDSAETLSLEEDQINLDDYLSFATEIGGFDPLASFDLPAPAALAFIEEDLAASMMAASQIII